MMKRKHIMLTAMLFFVLIGVFSVSMPSASHADIIKVEVKPFSDDSYKCNLETSQGKYGNWRWWKEPLKAVKEAAVSVGESTFSKSAGGAQTLMFVGMGLWLAIFTLKVVGGMQESDPLENMTKIGGMMIKVGIASALLSNQNFFFGYFVAPITEAGAGFVGLSSGGGSGLAAVVEPLEDLTEAIHKATSNLQGKGDFARCISSIFEITGLFEITFFDVGVWVTGCAVQIAGFLLMVFFPILIFDAYLRVGITAALCPLFIISWVFPSTSDFAKKGFNSILNVAFFFMCLKICMDMAVALLESAAGFKTLSDDPAEKTRAVCLTEGMMHWWQKDYDRICAKYKAEAETQTGLFVFFCCVIYGILLLKQATTFATHFSGAQFSNDTAYQAAKGAGGAIQHGVTKTAPALASRISKGRDRSAARTYETAMKQKEAGTYNPTKSQANAFAKAERRLKNHGALNRDGSENDAYRSLLQNGMRRTALRVASFGALGKNAANSYDGARTAADANKLNKDTAFMTRNVIPQSLGGKAKTSGEREMYQKNPQQFLNNKKAAITTSNAVHEAKALQAKRAKDDPNYAGSAQEKADNGSIAILEKKARIAQRKASSVKYNEPGNKKATKDMDELRAMEADQKTLLKDNGLSSNSTVGVNGARVAGTKMTNNLKAEAAAPTVQKTNFVRRALGMKPKDVANNAAGSAARLKDVKLNDVIDTKQPNP